jgi:hypothetical protein
MSIFINTVKLGLELEFFLGKGNGMMRLQTIKE